MLHKTSSTIQGIVREIKAEIPQNCQRFSIYNVRGQKTIHKYTIIPNNKSFILISKVYASHFLPKSSCAQTLFLFSLTVFFFSLDFSPCLLLAPAKDVCYYSQQHHCSMLLLLFLLYFMFLVLKKIVQCNGAQMLLKTYVIWIILLN